MPLEKGFTQVYTGNGKGKTTASLGLALRAAGAGLRVCIVQFLKGKRCSEHRLLSRLPGVSVKQFGTGCFVRTEPSDRDRDQARKALRSLELALRPGGCDVVIADEINVALTLGLVSEQEVLGLIAKRPPQTELVLTGRGASPKIVRAADLVTEMREKKHYFHSGVKSRRGIES